MKALNLLLILGMVGSGALLFFLLPASLEPAKRPDQEGMPPRAFPDPAAAENLRRAKMETEAYHKLRQLADAMRAYKSVKKELPLARFGGGLSWRVAILPYIGQKDLYDQFRLDEPWNSPHNIRLVDHMPAQYYPPSGVPSRPNHTYWQVITGEKTLFDPKGVRKISLSSDRIGATSPLLIVESSTLVLWTAPDDIRYEPMTKAPLPRLGQTKPGYFLAANLYGAVSWQPIGVDAASFDRQVSLTDGVRIAPPTGKK